MTQPTHRLSNRDRQAINLAHHLREQLGHWLNRRGITTATLLISPFVDPAGQPSVLVRMNAAQADH